MLIDYRLRIFCNNEDMVADVLTDLLTEEVPL